MPKIDIKSEGVGNAEVWMNGVKVPDLREVHVVIPLEERPQVHLEIVATEKIDMTVDPAEVHMAILVPPGFIIVARKISDNEIQYTCTTEPDKTETRH